MCCGICRFADKNTSLYLEESWCEEGRTTVEFNSSKCDKFEMTDIPICIEFSKTVDKEDEIKKIWKAIRKLENMAFQPESEEVEADANNEELVDKFLSCLENF